MTRLLGARTASAVIVATLALLAVGGGYALASGTGAHGPRGRAGPAGTEPTISGIVHAGGAIQAGSGFTVSHPSTGVYTIQFPPGTWSGFPVMTITPFESAVGIVVPVIVAELGSNGGATVTIHLSKTIPNQTLENSPFYFIAAQS